MERCTLQLPHLDERYCRGDWSKTKTWASAATVGVPDFVVARIQRLKTLEVEVKWGGKGAKKRFKLVRSDGPTDLVFQSVRTGAPMRDENILRRHLRPAALRLGLDPKKATWRSLRTSCATIHRGSAQMIHPSLMQERQLRAALPSRAMLEKRTK